MELGGRAALAALVVALAAASPATGQVSTVKGRGKALELVEITRRMDPNTNLTVYTVPEGRRLVTTGFAFESGVGVGIDNQGAGEGLYTLTGYLTKP